MYFEKCRSISAHFVDYSAEISSLPKYLPSSIISWNCLIFEPPQAKTKNLLNFSTWSMLIFYDFINFLYFLFREDNTVAATMVINDPCY